MSHTVREDTGGHAPERKGRKRPLAFKKKVDISKVNLKIIKQWLDETMQKQLPDDDIVVEFVYELLSDEPDILAIQEQMNNFLGEEESLKFCEELWKLLLSAQKDPDGIPEQLLQQQKRKVEQQTADQARAMLETMKSRSYDNRHRQGGHQGRQWDTARTGERHARVEKIDRRPKTNYNRGQVGGDRKQRKFQDEKNVPR